MDDRTFASLLEERRDDIITTIEMVTEESFLPDFYGTYEIYLNEADQQIYVFMAERGSLFQPKNQSMRYLHTVRSHAAKEGDFLGWLLARGIPVPKTHGEKKLMRVYPTEYRRFLAEIREDALREIVHADRTFLKIKEMYGLTAKGA